MEVEQRRRYSSDHRRPGGGRKRFVDLSQERTCCGHACAGIRCRLESLSASVACARTGGISRAARVRFRLAPDVAHQLRGWAAGEGHHDQYGRGSKHMHATRRATAMPCGASPNSPRIPCFLSRRRSWVRQHRGKIHTAIEKPRFAETAGASTVMFCSGFLLLGEGLSPGAEAALGVEQGKSRHARTRGQERAAEWALMSVRRERPLRVPKILT